MTSYRGSYSHKISAEFHPIGPTVVRRVLLYWHKLCFCQFCQRLIRSIHVHTIYFLTYTNSYVDILYMPGFNFQLLISKDGLHIHIMMPQQKRWPFPWIAKHESRFFSLFFQNSTWVSISAYFLASSFIYTW